MDQALMLALRLFLPEWIPILIFTLSFGREASEILKSFIFSNSSRANEHTLTACKSVGTGTPDETM